MKKKGHDTIPLLDKGGVPRSGGVVGWKMGAACNSTEPPRPSATPPLSRRGNQQRLPSFIKEGCPVGAGGPPLRWFGGGWKLLPAATLAVFFTTASAQRPLSLQTALQTATQQNGQLQTAALDLRQQQALRGTAFDVPRTFLDVQYGRTQTYFTQDYTVGVVQSFAWPGLYRAQAELLNRNAGLSQNRLRLSRVELASQLKTGYYRLLLNQRRRELLAAQDSLYQTAARAAAVRYRTGETNRLEQVSAEARLREVRNRALGLRADAASQVQTLQVLLDTRDSVQLDAQTPLKRPLPPDSVVLENNPLLAVLGQQTAVSAQQTAVERQRLKPDLRVGILNQSIENRHNQNVVQAGVGLPLFAGAQKARIQAAALGEQVVQSQLAYATRRLSGQLAALRQQIGKFQRSLDYYESSALPQADLILETALKSYRAGDIDYVEFFAATQQAWALREAYLTEIEQYNQVVIDLETLLGYEN